MAKAQSILAERLGVEATARLKTVNTIVEKLRREKTRLAEMQDAAGLRVVQDIGLRDQDELARQIVNLFPDVKVVDRRTKPTHGYRAVHVIATVDGFLVEIQVRTKMQDLWAQVVEKLADEIGREIRYGGVPAGHADTVEALKGMSLLIARLEEMSDELRQTELSLPSGGQISVGDLRLDHAQVARLKDNVLRQSNAVRDILRTILRE